MKRFPLFIMFCLLLIFISCYNQSEPFTPLYYIFQVSSLVMAFAVALYIRYSKKKEATTYSVFLLDPDYLIKQKKELYHVSNKEFMKKASHRYTLSQFEDLFNIGDKNIELYFQCGYIRIIATS